MNDVVVIGPVGISLIPLGFLLAAVTGYQVGRRLEGEALSRIERQLSWIFVAFLITARGWHVLAYWPVYAAHPASLLAILDGGWNIRAGLAICLACALLAWMVNARRWRGFALAVAAAAAVLLAFDRWLALRSVPAFSLPPLTLQGTTGRPPYVMQGDGKWQVINLWTTWCPSCLMEIPGLLQVKDEYPEVNFRFVDEGETGARVERLLVGKGWDATRFFLDPASQVQQQIQSDVIPVTLFVDPGGMVREVHRGTMSASQVRQALLRLQGDPS